MVEKPVSLLGPVNDGNNFILLGPARRRGPGEEAEGGCGRRQAVRGVEGPPPGPPRAAPPGGDNAPPTRGAFVLLFLPTRRVKTC